MKYIDRDEKIWTLIVKRNPFKGVENYFTDSLLYQDSLKTGKNTQPEEPDSGNEANVESEAKDECLWELNPLVMSINKLYVTNDAGEWYINEELDLAYFLCLFLIICHQILVPM